MKRIKRLIMENLPASQDGKDLDSLYSAVGYDVQAFGQPLKKEDFMDALYSLNEEQSLVVFRSDNIKATNYGLIKYRLKY